MGARRVQQRTHQVKTMLKGVKQSKIKNKNSTRGFFIKSLPVLGKSQKSWKLKKGNLLEGQKPLITIMSAWHLLTLHTQTSLNWGMPQPCSLFRAICHFQDTVSSWYPSPTPKMGSSHCLLAIKTISDHLEIPVTLMLLEIQPQVSLKSTCSVHQAQVSS